MFEKLYGNLIPGEYWDYEFQCELAREALNFNLVFNEECDNGHLISEPPYIFTRLSVYLDAYSLLAKLDCNMKEWCLSPDCAGGVAIIYLGTSCKIFTIDVNIDFNVSIEYFNEASEYRKTIFSWEVPVELKIIDIKKVM